MCFVLRLTSFKNSLSWHTWRRVAAWWGRWTESDWSKPTQALPQLSSELLQNWRHLPTWTGPDLCLFLLRSATQSWLQRGWAEREESETWKIVLVAPVSRPPILNPDAASSVRSLNGLLISITNNSWDMKHDTGRSLLYRIRRMCRRRRMFRIWRHQTGTWW